MIKPSIVDRTIHLILPPSSSFVDVPTKTKFLHTIHGTSIIYQSTTLLRTSPSTYATACTIFHRFYHRKSLKEYSVWSVALGSVFLACKVEEDQRRMQDVILIFVHVLRRMRLAILLHDVTEDDGFKSPSSLSSSNHQSSWIQTDVSPLLRCQDPLSPSLPLTQEEKQNILRYVRPLPQYSQLYKEWEYELREMENVILRELGFTLYWIPDSHPHLFLLYFCNVLGLQTAPKEQDTMKNDHPKYTVHQLAWNYCNDSYRIELCTRFVPEIIACAAIHLACVDENVMDKISLGMQPNPWWVSFVGSGRDQDMATICNALLALKDDDCVEGYSEARNKYVISLVEDGGCFCDPGGYIWNMLD